MNLEIIYAVVLGIALSACCGFRVFVPLFITSSLSYFGQTDIIPGFDWMNSLSAVIGFGVASLIETAAYYIPIVDHALDTIAAPLSVLAGTVLSASFFTEMDPALQWTMAAILGGGAAGTVQAGTTVTRLASTGLTAGIGNPIVATIENILATIMSILAFIIPVIVALIFLFTGIWLLRKYLNKKKKLSVEIPQ